MKKLEIKTKMFRRNGPVIKPWTENGREYNHRLKENPTVVYYFRDTCRFRVLIGNNGAMYFNAYPEPYNHAHSLHVYF